MRLSRILKNLQYKEIINKKNLDIKGICYHSKKAKKDYLFVAIKGQNTDGSIFAKEAISKGAKVVITEKKIDNIGDKIVQIIVDDSKIALAQVSETFYNFPFKKLKIIGITGTNGKTSTSFLLDSILRESNKKVGLIGTIYSKLNNKILKKSDRTTPMSLDLAQLFDIFIKNKAEYAVMEVSSQSLDLKRVYGIDFFIAVFLGLAPEHLDWHRTMRNYLKSKMKIIKENKTKYLLLNIDNKYSKEFLKFFPKKRTFTFGLRNNADFRASEIKISFQGTSFLINYPKGKKIKINLKLIGNFQAVNALAAFASAYLLKIPVEKIKNGLEKLKNVPGRFEFLNSRDLSKKIPDFKIIIDYAHTSNALKNLLENCQKLPHNRIISVFGCGGTRDKSKRKPMGEISAKLADFTIITSDNPRFEKPIDILNQIEKGVKRFSKNYLKIVDRKKAIKKALSLAKDGDLVVIAGKGHETYQQIGSKLIPFSDKKIVKEILKNLE